MTNTPDSYKLHDRPRVRVFRNLTQKCYSLQMREETGWRTCVHATQIVLSDVEFLIYEKSRLRILETGKKTVHAFAVGYCLGLEGNVVRPKGLELTTKLFKVTNGSRIRYSPHMGPWFMREGEKIEHLALLNMHADGLHEGH